MEDRENFTPMDESPEDWENLERKVNTLKEEHKAKDLTSFPFNQTRDQWRQVLAALAINGDLSNPEEGGKARMRAEWAFQMADAMIKEAEKGDG